MLSRNFRRVVPSKDERASERRRSAGEPFSRQSKSMSKVRERLSEQRGCAGFLHRSLNHGRQALEPDQYLNPRRDGASDLWETFEALGRRPSRLCSKESLKICKMPRHAATTCCWSGPLLPRLGQRPAVNLEELVAGICTTSTKLRRLAPVLAVAGLRRDQHRTINHMVANCSCTARDAGGQCSLAGWTCKQPRHAPAVGLDVSMQRLWIRAGTRHVIRLV